MDIVQGSFDQFPDQEDSRSKYRYISAAQDLVMYARGRHESCRGWRTNDCKPATVDDITVFVIPLKQYRDEYLEWKQSRLPLCRK